MLVGGVYGNTVIPAFDPINDSPGKLTATKVNGAWIESLIQEAYQR